VGKDRDFSENGHSCGDQSACDGLEAASAPSKGGFVVPGDSRIAWPFGKKESSLTIRMAPFRDRTNREHESHRCRNPSRPSAPEGRKHVARRREPRARGPPPSPAPEGRQQPRLRCTRALLRDVSRSTQHAPTLAHHKKGLAHHAPALAHGENVLTRVGSTQTREVKVSTRITSVLPRVTSTSTHNSATLPRDRSMLTRDESIDRTEVLFSRRRASGAG
jgi:hypothetical protein